MFVTFTCNPQWPEIGRLLLDKQRANDRPDIVARVFKMKYDELLLDIRHRNCFGKTVAGNPTCFLSLIHHMSFLILHILPNNLLFLIAFLSPFFPSILSVLHISRGAD